MVLFKRLLTTGTAAPDFNLLDQQGQLVSLETLKGKVRIIMVFYMRDFSSECTAQLGQLKDAYPQLQAHGVEVLGLNHGDWEKHRLFAEENTFPFPILYDHLTRTAKRYHALAIPVFRNRRTVYGIDLEGKICFARRGFPPTEEILGAFGISGAVLDPG